MSSDLILVFVRKGQKKNALGEESEEYIISLSFGLVDRLPSTLIS